MLLLVLLYNIENGISSSSGLILLVVFLLAELALAVFAGVARVAAALRFGAGTLLLSSLLVFAPSSSPSFEVYSLPRRALPDSLLPVYRILKRDDDRRLGNGE